MRVLVRSSGGVQHDVENTVSGRFKAQAGKVVVAHHRVILCIVKNGHSARLGSSGHGRGLRGFSHRVLEMVTNRPNGRGRITVWADQGTAYGRKDSVWGKGMSIRVGL